MYMFLVGFTVWVCFCRCLSLKIHFDLYQCNLASCTDISEQRAQRRAWQQNLNHEIQRITLELIVNIFRFCVFFLFWNLMGWFWWWWRYINVWYICMYITGMLAVIWTMNIECLTVKSSLKRESQLNSFSTRRWVLVTTINTFFNFSLEF